MGRWTLAHRIRWFTDHVRRGGLSALWQGIWARVSPAARATERRRIADGVTYDAASGYRTAGTLAIDDMTVVGEREGSRHYDGTPTQDIANALAMLDVPIAETTFVDLGCGMGRPLLFAADMPFKRIVGVEFARELLDIAAENFALRAAQQGPDDRIELVCGDAAALPVPEGSTVFFLNNSFGPPTLNRVLDHIHASWRETPRPIRFVYLNIQHLEDVKAAGFRQHAVAPDFKFVVFAPV